jgi:hypothetical protein
LEKRVSQSRATPAYWLAAGVGVAGIVALGGMVFFVPEPASQMPSPAVQAGLENSNSGGLPASLEVAPATSFSEPTPVRQYSTHTAALHTTDEAKNIDVSAEPAASATALSSNVPSPPRQPVRPQSTESGATHSSRAAAVLLAPLKPTSQFVSQPPIQDIAPTMVTEARNAPIGPASPRVKDEPRPQAQAVERVVVTAPSYQTVMVNVDSVGRGNSLVIQLPRTKRKS